MGKTIKAVGQKHQQLQNNGVGGQECVALPSALGGKEREAEQKAGGANEQVSIDGEHLTIVAELQELWRVELSGHAAQCSSNQIEADDQAGVFGDHGRQCGAFTFHVQAQDEQAVEHYVEYIREDHNDQWRAGVLLTDKPAHNRIVDEGGRRAVDSDGAIAQGQFARLRAGFHQAQSERKQPALKHEQQQG